MAVHCPVYIGPDAISQLVAFCRSRGLTHFVLIADRNTYAALGCAVEAALRQERTDIALCVFPWDDAAADARSVYRVLLALDHQRRAFLAVGSGTITDITRFVSHRAGADFIALPTAPSVDGFTSVGAPMIIEGAKMTVTCQGPLAVFADLPVLCAAPRPLIAAGAADLLAKLTAVADWELGQLLWWEPFDQDIARRARTAARECASQIESIARAESGGVRALMAGLLESGFCMLDFGDTRPASGYEHHISHYLEMRLLREGRPALLHGAKVGLGLLSSARLYAQIRHLDQAAVRRSLAGVHLPSRVAELARMRSGYGAVAEQLAVIQAPFLDMSAEAFEDLKRRVGDCWPEILRIARSVPAPEQIARWLRRVGSPTKAAELGISEEELRLAETMAHYYRERFTVAKLARLVGLGHEHVA